MAALPKTGVGTLSSLALVTILAAASPGNAGQPPNDQCANRTPIFLGDTPFDATGASTDGAPGCAAGVDIWYNFTADFSGTLRIEIDDFGAALGVYDGCGCPAQNLLGCAVLVSPLETPVVAGNCYKMQLTAFLGPGIGTLSLTPTVLPGACCLSDGSCADGLFETECVDLGGVFQGAGTACESVECPLANDDCENAIAIFNGETAFDTTNAGTDGPAHDSCQFDGQTYNDIWFNYNATFTGGLTISTCNRADYDTDIVVYEGCDCGLGLEDPPLACNDDFPDCAGFSSEVELSVVAGICYKIRVGGFQAPDAGTGLLNITEQFATGACCLDDGSCSDLTESECAALGGVFQGEGTACEGVDCPPANDDCLDGSPIADGLTGFDTTGATTDGELHTSCVFQALDAGQTYHDVWFNYTATCDGILSVSTCEELDGFSEFDSRLVVYDGCECGPGLEDPPLGCNDDDPINPCGGAPTFQSTLTVPVIAGQCYKIRVGGFADGADQGLGVLSVFCEAAGPLSGACCLADGGCLDLTEADCAAQGGAFQGGGTSCSASYVVVEGDNPFEDISGTGTVAPNASSAEDDGDVVDIGFTFSFFTDPHDQIGIASNGYLTFGTDLGDFSNDAIPDDIDPNDHISPWWDDWSPNVAGTVYYQTLGDPGQRRFIVQWDGVEHFGAPDGQLATFQAVLYERDNCIEFCYGATLFLDPDHSGPTPFGPTVGVENQDGTGGVSVDPTTILPGSCVRLCPVEASCACQWDLNNDRTVNVVDLIELLVSFGPCEGCPADFDDNGSVNVLDLIDMLLNLGPCSSLASPCPWDVNGDFVVDEGDYQSLLSNLGPCPTTPDPCPWDFNSDGVVDFTDAQEMLVNFGPCP